MDLAYTDEQQAFREEVRSWLAANVPAEPLQPLIPQRVSAAPRVGGHTQLGALGYGDLA